MNVNRAIALLASALLLAAIAPPGDAAAPERMKFGAYGDARIGDTPAEVRSKVPGVEPCYRLDERCVCSTVEVGARSVAFAYLLDRRSGLDLIFTSSTAVSGPRGIRVGDGVNRFKRLFPNAHPRPPIYGSQRFVVNKGRIGLLVFVDRGRITQLATGRNQFFHYVEYCS